MRDVILNEQSTRLQATEADKIEMAWNRRALSSGSINK